MTLARVHQGDQDTATHYQHTKDQQLHDILLARVSNILKQTFCPFRCHGTRP
jgi:hypothetical protein